ncbi:MAG: TPD domain-containing protein [Euryarchaeota archaeon]|nr:TPD domain-containing protein [Euryarchaeota archaeon]
MDEATYNLIYRSLNELSDIPELQKQFSIPENTLLAILTQKKVRKTKSIFHRIDREEIKKRWDSGESILSISNSLDFSPVLTASMLLNLTKREFRKMLEKPEEIKDERLRREIKEALENDFVYSPAAHRDQIAKAKIGEDVVRKWLLAKGIIFVAEKESRNKKTPDFLLSEPIGLEGRKIYWIDSKAAFGDEIEHRRCIKKQFSHYLETFGSGMVVYWYGFVDSIAAIEPRIAVKDFKFFGAKNEL